ncbi:hypothetical protein T265_06997 [Opisthorchis viverrini]|uniref:Uncharacterized protein n=1 Tax=Opisthorchis viverrini TaxID=6198 RepID=A0A074ZIB1_OPIVI|nr:hypothetical protein T265_06997 [Opisthorchis viverrini]KER25537.1 hypothetical protein T265_06997 [Opisthorchis viverrini]
MPVSIFQKKVSADFRIQQESGKTPCTIKKQVFWFEANVRKVKSSVMIFGDAEAMAGGDSVVGFALNPKTEKALKEWIPVNSRLFAVRLSGSIKFNAFC